MRKSRRFIIIALILIVSPVLLVGFYDRDFEISKNLDIYFTLFRELDMFYVDETQPEELVATSINNMLESLDPYTVYIPESKIEDFRLMSTGEYGGIGILVRQMDDQIIIVETYKDYPAYNAGLKAGDVVKEINGQSIENMNLDDVNNLIKGRAGGVMKIAVQRPYTLESIEKELIMQKVDLGDVPFYGLADEKTGYIRLTGFTEHAAEEVRTAFEELKEQYEIEGLILDLRANPGGLLMEAVKIMNIFVDRGAEIVSTRGKMKQWNHEYKTSNQAVDTEIPVAVIVNNKSASASEIIAGAMQDLDRGVIIGTRTFGKGLVQTTRRLSYNAQLKLTTAKYYIPSGRCIQALDYTHRNEDGSVGKIPDSLITEFKTKNGRTVYDGGGVKPDIEMEEQYLSSLSSQLILKNMIFHYATKFASSHERIENPRSFKLSNEIFEDFKTWLKNQDFDYTSRSKLELEKLRKIAEKEKYKQLAKSEFDALEEKLSPNIEKDLDAFHDEIEEVLREEIIGRYYAREGRIESILNIDENIRKALEILSDKDKYMKILSAEN